MARSGHGSCLRRRSSRLARVRRTDTCAGGRAFGARIRLRWDLTFAVAFSFHRLLAGWRGAPQAVPASVARFHTLIYLHPFGLIRPIARNFCRKT
jgi:hypothetical protein